MCQSKGERTNYADLDKYEKERPKSRDAKSYSDSRASPSPRSKRLVRIVTRDIHRPTTPSCLCLRTVLRFRFRFFSRHIDSVSRNQLREGATIVAHLEDRVVLHDPHLDLSSRSLS